MVVKITFKTNNKMKNLVTAFFCCLMVALCMSCSSDSDESPVSECKEYKYSNEEIRQINKLKEDYNVDFENPSKSDKPLPTIKEMEELCKMIASLNSSARKTTRNGNSITNVTPKRVRRRAFSDALEYSGSYEGRGTIDNYNCEFDYKVSWKNTNTSGCGDVKGEVIQIRESGAGSWRLVYVGFSYEYRASHTLRYTFHFEANYIGGYNVKKIGYTSVLSM